ncbi:MAG: hypothetical protein L3J02_02985 [Henriciella sp.]|nr:hypothetical protein [Henriciella sp.]
MFKSRDKRTDPYGIRPKAHAERFVMTHGDPVTIALACRVAENHAAAPRPLHACPALMLNGPAYDADDT